MKERWEEKTLGELGTLTSSKRIYKKEYVSEGIPFYRSKEIKELAHERDISLELFISKDRYTEIKSQFGIPQEGDILLTAVGTIGEMYVVKKNEPDFYFKDGNIMWLKNFSTLNTYYLRYALLRYVEQLKEMSQGSAYSALTIEKLKKYSISVPSISEQEKIVAILNKTLATIDQAKANIEKNIANAKELFQSKLNAIFSQKGNGWRESTLGEICENLDSKRIPITKSKRVSGEIPYYGASGIVDYVADYIFNEDLLLVSEDGANLLARTYPIAFSISGKTWVNNHAHALKFKNMTSQIFIKFYLNSIKLDTFISGMAQPKLNQRMLNSIPVPYPSIEIQEKVVFRIEKLSTQTKNINTQYQQKLFNLKELKKSMLQKAFAGELTNKLAVGSPNSYRDQLAVNS